MPRTSDICVTEFPNLKVLDISNADIKMYTGKAGTYPNGKLCVYMPNFIPTYAFSNIVDGVTKGKSHPGENNSLRENQEHRRRRLPKGARTGKSARSEKTALTCCRRHWRTTLPLFSFRWAAAMNTKL